MAGILGQMSQMYKLQKEAREMQRKMKAQTISGFSRNEDVEIVIDGTQEVIDIGIKDEIISAENKTYLIKAIKEALKDAQGKLQKDMMKNMDMDKLKSMLGAA